MSGRAMFVQGVAFSIVSREPHPRSISIQDAMPEMIMVQPESARIDAISFFGPSATRS